MAIFVNLLSFCVILGRWSSFSEYLNPLRASSNDEHDESCGFHL